METVHIELDINVDETEAAVYQKIAKDVHSQLSSVVSRWLKRYLEKLEPESKVDKEWLEFLYNIDEYAVDTGNEDLSINHEYYLYGEAKRS